MLECLSGSASSSVASCDLISCRVLSNAIFARAMCCRMACMRFGPRITYPSPQNSSSSVPKPAMRASLTLVYRRTGLAGNFGLSVYGRFEPADAFADSFAEFREFLGPEHEQGETDDDEQMHGLKESFKHTYSSRQLSNPTLCQRRAKDGAPTVVPEQRLPQKERQVRNSRVNYPDAGPRRLLPPARA